MCQPNWLSDSYVTLNCLLCARRRDKWDDWDPHRVCFPSWTRPRQSQSKNTPTYLSCFNICEAKGVPENGMPIKIHPVAPSKLHSKAFSPIVKVEDRRIRQQNVLLKGFPHSGSPVSLPDRESSAYGVNLLMERGTPRLKGQGSQSHASEGEDIGESDSKIFDLTA